MEKITWQCYTALDSGASETKQGFLNLHVSTSCPRGLAIASVFKLMRRIPGNNLRETDLKTVKRHYWSIEKNPNTKSSAYLDVNLQARNAKSGIRRASSYSPTTCTSRSSSELPWYLRNLCQDQETLPTVDSEAIIWKNTSLPEVKHTVWCELTILLSGWTRYHGKHKSK